MLESDKSRFDSSLDKFGLARLDGLKLSATKMLLEKCDKNWFGSSLNKNFSESSFLILLRRRSCKSSTEGINLNRKFTSRISESTQQQITP